MSGVPFTRRTFLKAGGALVVTFGYALDLTQTQAATAAGKSVPATKEKNIFDGGKSAEEVGGFLAIDAEGLVTLFTGKVEIGTGVFTALTQMAAEELSVSMRQVTTIQGDTLLTPNQGPTFSSLSIQNGGMQVRRAAATARETLLAQAAKKLGVGKDQLTVRDGVVASRSGKSITYAQLVGGKEFTVKVDANAPLKSPKDFTLIGTSVPRLDIPAKVFGTFAFMQDFRLPGMLHARMVHPASVGANLESFDDAACREIPGYVRSVRKGNFLAVVATDEWAAVRAATAIAPKWSAWAGLPDLAKLPEHVRNSKTATKEVLQSTVAPGGAPKAGGKSLQATYDFAINTHGSIGPSCAVAEFKNGQLTVWTPTQASHALRVQLGTMLQLDRDHVRCIYVQGAGCYGRNGADDCSSEAAFIAKEIGGPVRLQWMRADEHGWDPKSPPMLLDYRADIDDQGRIVNWDSDIFLPLGPADRSGATLLAAVLAGLPRFQLPGFGKNNPGLGITYGVPNSQLTAHWLVDTPFRSAWLRTPAVMHNTFGNESFLDEIAAAVAVDPFEMRTRSLTDARALELLQRLRQISKWRPRGSSPRDTGTLARGRGVSYVKFEMKRTYIGVVADVTVDRTTGKIRVDRVFVAHDCGQIINPDGTRNQVEGNVVQAASRTLLEEVTFSTSTVTSLDWASYPILTFPDVPRVTVDLIDRPSEPPWGVGEATTAVIPAAIANAVFDATGARLRSVPFRPDKVLAALNVAKPR